MYIHAIFVYLKWKEKTIELNLASFTGWKALQLSRIYGKFKKLSSRSCFQQCFSLDIL